jgi:hypothetical protein
MTAIDKQRDAEVGKWNAALQSGDPKEIATAQRRVLDSVHTRIMRQRTREPDHAEHGHDGDGRCIDLDESGHIRPVYGTTYDYGNRLELDPWSVRYEAELGTEL